MIQAGDGTEILNSFVSGARTPVRINSGTVTIANSTISGGSVANIDVKGGTLNLNNVTTINQGTDVVGYGIFMPTKELFIEEIGFDYNKSVMVEEDRATFGHEVMTYTKDKKTITTDFVMTDMVVADLYDIDCVNKGYEMTVKYGKTKEVLDIKDKDNMEYYKNGESVEITDLVLDESVNLIYKNDELIRVVQWIASEPKMVNMTVKQFEKTFTEIVGDEYIPNESVITVYGDFAVEVSNDYVEGRIIEISTVKNSDDVRITLRNGDKYAVAVRKADKEIDVQVFDCAIKNEKLKKLPIIRGVLNFVDSLYLGMTSLFHSASFFEEEEEQLDEKKEKAVMGGTIVLAIALAIGIFFVLPYVISQFFRSFIQSRLLITLLEGVIRLSIFIGYVGLISFMEDIKRTYMYHGAEHKCINCIEHGLELTVENVKKSSKQHKRCGTSFLLIVMLISILFFMFIEVESGILKLVIRLLLIPLIAGVAYEFIRLAGRYENWFTNLISIPGLWMQELTTKEPDDDMIEVAIASVEAVFDWKQWQKENIV